MTSLSLNNSHNTNGTSLSLALSLSLLLPSLYSSLKGRRNYLGLTNNCLDLNKNKKYYDLALLNTVYTLQLYFKLVILCNSLMTIP